MINPPALAFIDVETTGLDPITNRIAEIGVVTVDGGNATEWTTFIAQRAGRARRPRGETTQVESESPSAPSFREIASELAYRLAGRVLVAHNARFDYAFLRSEFERAGVDFRSQILCSVMLSRHFYPQHARHDLDSLTKRHNLNASVRHRALPDARLIWQLWQTIHREFPAGEIAAAVSALLSGPVLPEQLDQALLDRMPEAPGVYIFHDSDGKPFHVGDAQNLRLHLLDYFRLDRAPAKALAMAHRIKKLTWRVTEGILGARLHRVIADREISSQKHVSRNDVFLWQLMPDKYPSVMMVGIDRVSFTGEQEYFGMFRSKCRAQNALCRLAKTKYLCHGLL